MRMNGSHRGEITVDSHRSATYTAKELKELLGINFNAVYKAAAEGTIPHIRIGKRFVFPRTAIDRWLASAGSSQAA